MDSKILRDLCESYGSIYEESDAEHERSGGINPWKMSYAERQKMLRDKLKKKKVNKEEVESWVESLIDEGYDLSEYTWEEIYEAYLEEAPNWAARQELARLGSGLGKLKSVGTSLAQQIAKPALGAYTVLNTKAQQASAKDFQRRSGGVRPGELYRASDVGPDGKPKAGATTQTRNIETAVRGGTAPPRLPQQPQQPLVGSDGRNVFDGTSARPPAPSPTRTTPAASSPRPASSIARGSGPTASSPRPAATPAAQPKPAAPTGPAIGKLGSTSFEIRTPTSAELKAAQKARAGGASPEEALKAAQKTNLPTTGPTPAIPDSGDVNKSIQNFKPRDMNKNPLKPATQTNSFEWGSTSKLVDDIANLYQSVYEAKKVDQDEDGDNDFADVRIARLIASGMSKEEAIAKVKNKPYNEEFVTEDPVQDFRDMRRSKENAAGMRGPELSHSAKPAGSAKQKPQKPEPRSREFSHGGTNKLTGPSSPGYDTRRLGGYDLRRLANSYEFEGNNVDEATRMRKELGKEGEIATRKELARRSKSFKRSDTVDKTIAAAEREADRTTARNRDESEGDYKTRMQKRSQTLRRLAANRRKSVRSGEGLRGYAAKVEGSDKDLQSTRGSARSAGTLTNKERKQFGEEFDLWVNALIYEGYDLSDYTWDEMYEIYEETEEERKRNDRRARVAELHASGRVMTSSKRASQKAAQRKQDKKEEMADRVLRSIQSSGSTRSSSTPMGSETPEPKEAAPKANRKLSSSMKKDTLASKADELLRMLQNENYQRWVNKLLDEGYELDNWTDEELVELYVEIFG